MSVSVMGLCWYVKDLTPAQKVVLVALADHAEDDGSRVYPGVERLTYKTSLSERTVRRALSDLREKGLLIVIKESTYHKSTEYRIDLTELQVLQKRPARDTKQDLPENTKRPARDAPKPSVNHHLEPSEEEDRPNIFNLYEDAIGLLTPGIADELGLLEDDYPVMWIEDAFAIAKKNKAKSLKYVVSILSRWNANGKDDGYKKNGKKKSVVDEEMYDRIAKELAKDGE